MMRKILVNINSDSVKVYEQNGDIKRLILEKKIFFKDNYSIDRGLNFNDEEALVRLLERVSVNFLNCRIEARIGGFFSEIDERHLKDLFQEVKKRARMDLQLA